MPESAIFCVGEGKGFLLIENDSSLVEEGEYVARLTGVLRGGEWSFAMVLEAELV